MDYSVLVETYEKLYSTPSRIEKTTIIAELLNKTEDLEKITLLLQGKVFPNFNEKKIGIASKLVIKALQISTGASLEKINQLWKKLGDIGDVAEEVSKTKTQHTLFSRKLTIEMVFNTIKKLALVEGMGSVDIKLKMISELISSSQPNEVKYITRTLLEDLRVGVGDGTLRDAIVEAFLCSRDEENYKEQLSLVQKYYDITNDFGKTAEAAKNNTLKDVKLTIGIPIKVMLFQKAKNFKEAFERVGIPAVIEDKYDGFRVQIHKKDKTVKLFTRQLEDVTNQFPDVVFYISEIKCDCIIDAEIIGIDKETKKYLPFQQISQRIKRKHNIEDLVKKLPVVVRVFDLMFCEENYLDKSYKERWGKLKEIIKPSESLHLATHKQISTEEDGKLFFENAINKGNEGVMMKKLDAPYKPGSRVGYGIKIKNSMDELDLVITKAEWGAGKRREWLASFTIACDDNGELKEVGKVGTGIKEKSEEGLSFEELTNLLKPLIISESGRTVTVKPRIILEVQYEEIQSSPSYSSGFALRFPRVIRLRPDKKEISSFDELEMLYQEQ